MSRMTARAGRAVAAVIGGIVLAGCHFAVVPPKATSSPHTTGSPSAPAAPVAEAPMQRLADAPALLVQCAIDQVGLRPAAGQDWLTDGKVSITTTDATNFNTWWAGHDTPGPYTETFVIDGHRTHYLSFGATWVLKNGQWMPEHAARTDPLTERYSIYAWANWAAQNDKLPPAVCGTSATASQLQGQVFGGSGALNPWGE
jgi:hypothetical protein